MSQVREGPSLPQGGNWPTEGLSLRWLVGGERMERGGGPPLACLGCLTKAFPVETHSFQMLLPKTGQEPLSVTSSQDHLGGRKGRPWGLGWWERCPLALLQGSLGGIEQEARASGGG